MSIQTIFIKLSLYLYSQCHIGFYLKVDPSIVYSPCWLRIYTSTTHLLSEFLQKLGTSLQSCKSLRVYAKERTNAKIRREEGSVQHIRKNVQKVLLINFKCNLAICCNFFYSKLLSTKKRINFSLFFYLNSFLGKQKIFL